MRDLRGSYIYLGAPVVFAQGHLLRIGIVAYRDHEKSTAHILWSGTTYYRKAWGIFLVARCADELGANWPTWGTPSPDAFGNDVYHGSDVVYAYGNAGLETGLVEEVPRATRAIIDGYTRSLADSVYRIPSLLEHLDDVVEV